MGAMYDKNQETHLPMPSFNNFRQTVHQDNMEGRVVKIFPKLSLKSGKNDDDVYDNDDDGK